MGALPSFTDFAGSLRSLEEEARREALALLSAQREVQETGTLSDLAWIQASLYIRDKRRRIIPLVLNDIQRYYYERRTRRDLVLTVPPWASRGRIGCCRSHQAQRGPRPPRPSAPGSPQARPPR